MGPKPLIEGHVVARSRSAQADPALPGGLDALADDFFFLVAHQNGQERKVGAQPVGGLFGGDAIDEAHLALAVDGNDVAVELQPAPELSRRLLIL